MGLYNKLIRLFREEAPPVSSVQPYDELPYTNEQRVGGYEVPKFRDKISDLNPDAYSMMRSCKATLQPIKKLGQSISCIPLKVVGEGPRAEAIQAIHDQAHAFPAFIRDAVWAYYEGVTFHQIKVGATREGPDAWIIPSFKGGTFRKINAGGTMAPYIVGSNVVKQRQYETTIAGEESLEASYPRDEFIVFRPGNGTNPEGDLDLGLCAYKAAQFYNFVEKILQAYAERHGLPREVFQTAWGKMRPTQLETLGLQKARTIAGAKPGEILQMGVADLLKIVEPSGQSASFLLELKREIAGDVHKLILLQELTSSTKDAGPAGSSTVHYTEEQKAIRSVAKDIEESLNDDYLPWIIRNNPDLPPLGENDSEVYFEFEFEAPEDELTLQGDMEDDGNDNAELPEGDGAEVDDETYDDSVNLEVDEEVVVMSNPYKIAKRGSKYCVVKVHGGKVMGCHLSRARALKQFAALEIAAHKE